MTRWLGEHAAELGADRGRLAVGGDSMGGGFAAVVVRRAAKAGVPVAVEHDDGMIHVFFAFGAVLDRAKEATERAAAALRDALA